MNLNPLVSVIVPNFNHAEFIEQRLESILTQTFRDFEVIILDDCSEDNSRDLLLSYKSHSKVSHCIFNEVNSGNTYKQWNKGIRLSRGRFIWIAESDDFCEANFLEEMLKPLINDKEISLVYCQSNRVNSYGNITGNWLDHTSDMDTELFNNNFILSGNEFNYRFLIERNVIPNASAVVFGRDIIEQVGLLNEDNYLKYNGDWLLYFKLITNSKIAFIGKSLNNFRYHKKSVIARAVQNENQIFLLEIEMFTRRKMMEFSLKEVEGKFYRRLERKNHYLTKALKYKKAKIHLSTGNWLKAYLSFLWVLDLVVKNSKIQQRIKSRIDKIYKSIF